MNYKVFILIIIECIAIESLQKVKVIPNNTDINILNAKSKFFYRINFSIHTVTNQLFLCIKLDKKEINSERFQDLLLSHLSFNMVAQSYYKVYDKIKNVVKVKEVELDDLAQNVTDTLCDSPDYNVTQLSNITFYVDHIYNYDIYSKKENDDSIESFNNIWLKLSDKFFENIINPILEDDKKESIVANNTEIKSHSISQDSETWRDLLNAILYFNKLAQKYTQLNEEPKNVSHAILDTRENNSLQNSLDNIIGTEFHMLVNNSSKLAHILMETERFYNNNLTDQHHNIDSVTRSKTTLSKSSEKIKENIIKQILDENEEPDNKSEQQLNANETRRIYKGKKAKVKRYPFMASLHLMSEFLCAGSIISSDMVLTAASCLKIVSKNKIFRYNARIIFVRVGSAYTKRFGRLVPAADIIFHPEYDSVTLRHNLAIVKLLEPVPTNKKKIKKIKYAVNEDILLDVIDVKILGWGAKDVKDKMIGIKRLSVARLDIYNIKDCEEIFTSHYVTESNLCAGFVSRGGGACMGDVGGPAVVAGKLVGVISFGARACGTPDVPTVFTKVSSYAKWIDGIVNMEKIDEPPRTNVNSISFKRAKSLAYPKTSTEPSAKDLNKKQMDILKKLILKVILVNDTAIDYVTDTKVLELETKKKYSQNNEKIYIDMPVYNDTNDAITVKAEEKNATKPVFFMSTRNFLRNNNDFMRKTTLRSIIDDQINDYEDNNSISTFEKSFSESQSEDVSLYDSSYYEIGIPIDESPFEKGQKTTNKAIPNQKKTYDTMENQSNRTQKEIVARVSKPWGVTRKGKINNENLRQVEDNGSDNNLKSSLNMSFDLFYLPGKFLFKSHKPTDIATTSKKYNIHAENKPNANHKLESDADWDLESVDSLTMEDFKEIYDGYEDKWKKRASPEYDLYSHYL